MAWGPGRSRPPPNRMDPPALRPADYKLALLSCLEILTSSRTTGKEAEDTKIRNRGKIVGRAFRKDKKKKRTCENRKRTEGMPVNR